MALAEEGVAEAEEAGWEFRYFGVSTGAEQNILVSSGEGISGDVSLGSAIFAEDGSVATKGGKFVADSPADGGSYYYTVIDPTTTNFYLQADVTVDAINPTPDGQEGFALMVRDSLGEEGVSGSWMANLVSVGATKLPIGGVNTKPDAAATTGIRAYAGIQTPEASDFNDIRATRYGWWSKDGVANVVEAGKTYRFSLEKTDNAYITTQYDVETGEEIGSYTYYIPAADSSKTTVESYADLSDPVTVQEANAAYVSLVVARGLNATFKNITFTTSEWKAENWEPQPTQYYDLTGTIASAPTTTGGSYGLIFFSFSDGTANIYKDDSLVAEGLEVAKDTYIYQDIPMEEEKALVSVEFTPNPDFVFSVFEKLSSYDTATFTAEVTQRSLGSEGVIYVSAEGKEENDGSSFESAVDVQTAVSYVAPGQTILMKAETYDLTDAELMVGRGRNGSEEAPIVWTTEGDGFATLDFGTTGTGLKVWGDYWQMARINVTGTVNGLPGMQLAGHHCLIERMNFYNNGNTGLQISGISDDPNTLWPAYNTIQNCTSMNNADKAVEDADGFAAKLTCGEGNVFDSCIAAFNADDGWDLFAKVATGEIGAVMIQNSLAYQNGYLYVTPESEPKNFVLSAVTCDEAGNLSFAEETLMEAGDGNGFKMGGSNLPGGHTLMNSISYCNKAKGIDSNSCPDIKVYDCTAYNNGLSNIALYTGNTSAATGYAAKGVMSFRSGEEAANVSENIALQKQVSSAVFGDSCSYWDEETKTSVNGLGTAAREDWFVSLDTSVAPQRREDGSIDMHGLLMLTEEARKETTCGAKGSVWGQEEAIIWVVGDSTVSPFSDKYYLPREGYGEEISSYFNAKVYNLAHSGASSRDFTGMEEYSTLMEGSSVVPALGDAEGEKFLLIGFGHNDEKTEEARFSDPNGDYQTEGSFAHSLYVSYIQPALERGVTPVVCTPLVRLTDENTAESYEGAEGHVTEDVTIGEVTYPGGSYVQAILDMVSALQAEGMNVEVIDLTKASLEENVSLGEEAKWLHSFTGAKYAEDGITKIATGLDKTHTNAYGAKVNAYLIATLSKETAPSLAKWSFEKEKPSYEAFFEGAINPDYEVIDYKSPTEEDMNTVSWPVYTDEDGHEWRGTVFGDIGGEEKITEENFNVVINEDNTITLTVANNSGKIASGSDGILFYYTKLPVGTKFTISAKAQIEDFFANNQVSFGLMARDDLYLDSYVPITMGDYVAAASRNQGAIVNYGRKSGALVGEAPVNAIDLNPGATVDLKIVGTSDGFTLSYGDEVSSAGFDYPLTGVDEENMFVGFYVVRNCSVTFSDIHLVLE